MGGQLPRKAHVSFWQFTAVFGVACKLLCAVGNLNFHDNLQCSLLMKIPLLMQSAGWEGSPQSNSTYGPKKDAAERWVNTTPEKSTSVNFLGNRSIHIVSFRVPKDTWGNSRTPAVPQGTVPSVQKWTCISRPCAHSGGRRRRPRDPIPAMDPRANRQQKSRSSRAEHPKTPHPLMRSTLKLTGSPSWDFVHLFLRRNNWETGEMSHSTHRSLLQLSFPLGY